MPFSRPPASPTAGTEPPLSPGDHTTEADSTPTPAPAPKSWADLVRTKGPQPTAVQQANGNGVGAKDAFGASKSAPLAEAIRGFSVNSNAKVSFLEPRGLVNTGNMCYMNSVCPFAPYILNYAYDILDFTGSGLLYTML